MLSPRREDWWKATQSCGCVQIHDVTIDLDEKSAFCIPRLGKHKASRQYGYASADKQRQLWGLYIEIPRQTYMFREVGRFSKRPVPSVSEQNDDFGYISPLAMCAFEWFLASVHSLMDRQSTRNSESSLTTCMVAKVRLWRLRLATLTIRT